MPKTLPALQSFSKKFALQISCRKHSFFIIQKTLFKFEIFSYKLFFLIEKKLKEMQTGVSALLCFCTFEILHPQLHLIQMQNHCYFKVSFFQIF